MSNICFICKQPSDTTDIFELGEKDDVFQVRCKDTALKGMAVLVCRGCQRKAISSLILTAVSELRDKR